MTLFDLQGRMPRGIFACTTQRDLDVLVDQRRVSCFGDSDVPGSLLFLLRCA